MKLQNKIKKYYNKTTNIVISHNSNWTTNKNIPKNKNNYNQQ